MSYDRFDARNVNSCLVFYFYRQYNRLKSGETNTKENNRAEKAMAETESAVSPSAKKRVRWLIYGGAFGVLAFLVVGFRLVGCAGIVGMEPWIELLNGSTWPTDPPPTTLCGRSILGFSAALALRTTLNLGAALALVALPIELFIYRRKRTMDVRQLLKSRELAALQAVKLALASSPDLRDMVLKEIEAAGEDWDNEYLSAFYPAEVVEQILSKVVHEAERPSNRPGMNA
jgi:hypothetical protein